MLATGKRRSRFNLLLLEDSEVFFDEYLASLQVLPPNKPVPNNSLSRSSRNKKKTVRTFSGRLMVCSRGLFFDPDDIKQPITKLPFRSVVSEPHVQSGSSASFSLHSSQVIEMKRGGVVGPYVTRKFDDKKTGGSGGSGSGAGGVGVGGGSGSGSGDESPTAHLPTYLLTLEHSTADVVLPLVSRLWTIAKQTYRAHSGKEKDLLQPLVYERHMGAFDLSLLSDFRERPLTDTLLVQRVRPSTSCPARLLLTTEALYCQPVKLNNIGETVVQWRVRDMQDGLRRRRLLRNVGLEVLMKSGESVFFAFETEREREDLYTHLNRLLHTSVAASPSPSPPSSSSLRGVEEWRSEAVAAMTRRWQTRDVSNYEYLMFLNTTADRSTNDFTQYPVFPWIIADYSSRSLDLTNPDTFRDLSKPIGALNPDRLESVMERYKDMPRDRADEPPFMYGTHYSTPGYVLFYLVRALPEHMLHLQNGKFDAPDRMFNSVAETWDGVHRNLADLKELIPEFYSGDGDFLMNHSNLDLGVRMNGRPVRDVALPPWASDAYDFVDKCRQALECDYVSERLHLWIDLVFGYRQQGPAAEAAYNLFHPLTYEGAVDIDRERDPQRRAALQAQISEFGQTPKQLFTTPHPNRNELLSSADKDTGKGKASSGKDVKGGGGDLAELGSGGGGGTATSFDTPTLVLPDEVAAGAGAGSSPKASSAAGTTAAAAAATPSKPPPPSSSPAPPTPPPNTLASGGPSSPMSAAPPSSSASSISDAPVIIGRPRQESTVPSAVHNWKPVDLASTSPATPTSPDAAAAAATDMDWVVVEEFSAVRMHREAVSAVSLSSDPSASLLYSVSKDGVLKIYDSQENRQVTKAVITTVPLLCCGLSSGDRCVVIGCWDGKLAVYNVGSGKVTSTPAHDEAVSCLAQSAAGDVFVTGSWDQSVKVWGFRDDALTGSSPDAVFREHSAPVTTVAIHPSGSTAMSGSADGLVIMYDVSTRSMIAAHDSLMPQCIKGDVQGGGASGISASAWVADTRVAVVGCADGRVAVFDTHRGLSAIVTSGEVIRGLCCDSTGGCVMSAGSAGAIQFWDIRGAVAAKPSDMVTRHASDAKVGSLSFGVSTGPTPANRPPRARGVSEMDDKERALLASGKLANWVLCCSIAGASPDGSCVDTTLVAGGRSGSIKLWRRASSESPSSDESDTAVTQAEGLTVDGIAEQQAKDEDDDDDGDGEDIDDDEEDEDEEDGFRDDDLEDDDGAEEHKSG